ncbi:type II toxin-antitoxin system HicA family toxin [Crocosphaera sp. XPORK-15E]|nr:type II toxin-antitoxin system HicA family toxin [Crocosphaera sp. XPORK-15E]
MSEDVRMKGSEFIRKIKKLAKKRGIEAYVDKKRGKGSHVTLYFGDRLTIVRNPSDELKTRTLKAMLKQLDLKENDITTSDDNE